MIGRTNGQMGGRIKETVLIHDYMHPVQENFNNATKTFTIPEDGVYRLSCCCNVSSPTEGAIVARITHNSGLNSYTDLCQLSRNPGMTENCTAVIDRIYDDLKSGTVVSFYVGGFLYGYTDKDVNGYKVTKIEGL